MYEFINLMHIIYGFEYIVKFDKIICLYNTYGTVDNYTATVKKGSKITIILTCPNLY